MQVNKYKITVPVSPDSINQAITYGKFERDIVILKHKWQRLAKLIIDCAIIDGDLPAKFHGRVAFFFKIYFETDRQRDGDNYEAMCKGIIDAFVNKQMIKDDNSDYVDDDGRRLRVDQERPRIEVYIKEKIPGNSLVSIQEYGGQGNNKLPSTGIGHVERPDDEIRTGALAHEALGDNNASQSIASSQANDYGHLADQ